MTTPLVSILVPCHDAAPWLATTLDSVLNQTWPNREIIVVDDGSSDSSAEIARSYAGSGVQLHSQKQSGAAAARNRAFALSKGDYIQYLDADDLISPDKISAQLRLLARQPANTLATCAWGRFSGDPAGTRFVDDAVFRDFTPVDFLVLAGETGAMMHPSAWLVPRSVAERAGPWDQDLTLNDDGEYFARVALAAPGMAYCSESGARSYYRSSLKGSLSQRRDQRSRRSHYRSLELITAHLISAEDSPRTHHACAGYWGRFVHDFYPEPRDLISAAEEKIRLHGGRLGLPPMGPKTRMLASLVGWRLVWRLKHLIHS